MAGTFGQGRAGRKRRAARPGTTPGLTEERLKVTQYATRLAPPQCQSIRSDRSLLRGNAERGLMKRIVRTKTTAGLMAAGTAAGIVLVSGGPASQLDTIEVITVTGYDQNGELVMQDFDADPVALMDVFGTGPGDADMNGVCDLNDLNLVLTNMGRDYASEATSE